MCVCVFVEEGQGRERLDIGVGVGNRFPETIMYGRVNAFESLKS